MHGHCDRVPVTLVFGPSPMGVQNDTDCPRARAHTHTHKPLVRLFRMNESWEHCTYVSQVGKEIDIDDGCDLRHTDGWWETRRWSVFVQMHRSHEVASIRN